MGLEARRSQQWAVGSGQFVSLEDLPPGPVNSGQWAVCIIGGYFSEIKLSG